MVNTPGFADIAVDGAPADFDLLTYAIPDAMRGMLEVGSVVWVPLRKHFALGVVLGLHDVAPTEFSTRPIASLTEPLIVVRSHHLAVAAWMARETAASRFSCIEPFLPPGIQQRTVETIELAPSITGGVDLTPAQRRGVELLVESGPTPIETARTALKSRLTTVIPALEEMGAVTRGLRATNHVPEPRRQNVVVLVNEPPEGALRRAPKQQAIVDVLLHHQRGVGTGAALPSAVVLRRSGSDRAALSALVKKGFVSERAEVVAAPDPEELADLPIPMLTHAQSAAWEEIERLLAAGSDETVLLHGVTGSGKTEIYLRAIGWCLRRGKGAILLVPEIALATQIVRRVTARFPDRVAMLHSALNERERAENWHAVAGGVLPVVVGPR
ncbi:MAG: DEAD/DEAH box helicase, partial [Chloroflexota bacterium]